MVDLPKKKAGIVACSGEEIPEGTVSRMAALKVLHELRRGDTVTICLPLFLAGGEGDRAFASVNPTITIDGCSRRCAAIGTEKYSARPAVSVVVTDLMESEQLPRPLGRRRLDAAGERVANKVAQVVAELVDEVLGRPAPKESVRPADDHEHEAIVGSCSCGSGIPVLRLTLDGEEYELIAVPAIFDQLAAAGRVADRSVMAELMEQVKIYNSLTVGIEAGLSERLLDEFRLHLERRGKR